MGRQPIVHGSAAGRCRDEMDGVGAGADRATDDDQAISDQMTHERGMVIPAVLFADSAAVVPRRAVYECAKKEGHGLTLGETSGKGSARCQWPSCGPRWWP